MDTQNVASLPELTSIGKKTPADAVASGLTLVQPARDLTTAPSGWRALDHLPEDTDEAKVRADAKALAANKDLNQLSFVNFLEGYDVDATPAVDEMLASVKARNAGEAGQRVVMITTRCRKFGRSIPKPNAKFMAKWQAGKAKAGEVLDMAKWLTKQLQRFIAGYEDILELAEGEQTFHLQQSALSMEACATALGISHNEDEREDALINVTAILEALQEELAIRLKGELDENDRVRLNMVAMLVVARIKNVRPMIQDANGAVKQFAIQSNSLALTAMDQIDFATYGLAVWRRNIAGQILSESNIAMNLAYLEAIHFTEEQAEATMDAFDEQMQSMAQMLESELGSVETITRMTDSLVAAGDIMAQALEKAQDQSEVASRVIGDCKLKIAASERKLSDETARILQKGT